METAALCCSENPDGPQPMRGRRAVQKLAAWATASLLGGGPALAHTSFDIAGAFRSKHFPVNRIALSSKSFDGTTVIGLAACKRQPDLLVVVVAAHEPVVVGTNFSLGELKQLASRNGLRGKHNPFGFYISKFGYAISVDILEPILGGCEGTVRIRVDMALTERRIEIGREVGEDACLFPTVLEHYSRHAAFDDNVVSRFVQRTKIALSRAPTPPLQGGAQSIEDDRSHIRDFAEEIVQQGLPAFRAERDAAAEEVDTPAELQKLAEGCSTHA